MNHNDRGIMCGNRYAFIQRRRVREEVENPLHQIHSTIT